MDLPTKIKYAKQAIDSITTHDDVIMEAVEMAANDIKAHVDIRLAEAKARRIKAAGVVINGPQT